MNEEFKGCMSILMLILISIIITCILTLAVGPQVVGWFNVE